MCDVPIDYKKTHDNRRKAEKILDEGEEDAIFHPKTIRDTEQNYEAPAGRRNSKNKDKSSSYQPKKAYSNQGSMDMDENYDLDGQVKPKSSSFSGNNHKSTAADAEDNVSSSSGGHSSYSNKSDMYTQQ